MLLLPNYPDRRRDGRPAGHGREHGREHGQVVVLFGLLLVVIILFTGLVVDVGNGYVQRRKTQNIADFAALAATRVVVANMSTPGRYGDSDVKTAVNAILTDNGLAANAFSGVYVDTYGNPMVVPVGAGGGIPTGAAGARINVTQDFNTYFVSVVGMTKWSASSSATARGGNTVATQVTAGELLPIAMDFAAISSPICPSGVLAASCTEFDLAEGVGTGNFGWLIWPGFGGSAPDLCTMLTPPFPSPAYTVPQNGYIPIDGNTGVSNSSCIRDAIQNLAGHTYYVPIVSPGPPGTYPGTTIPYPPKSTGHGLGVDVNIIGFAGVEITGCTNPCIKNMTAVLRKAMFLGPPSGHVTSSTPGSSLTIQLVR